MAKKKENLIDFMANKLDDDIIINKSAIEEKKSKEKLKEQAIVIIKKQEEQELKEQKESYDSIVSITKKVVSKGYTFAEIRTLLEAECGALLNEGIETSNTHKRDFNVYFNALLELSNKGDLYWEFCNLDTYKKELDKRSARFQNDGEGEFVDFLTSEIRNIEQEQLLLIDKSDDLKVEVVLSKLIYNIIHDYTEDKVAYLGDLLLKENEEKVDIKDDEVLQKQQFRKDSERLTLMNELGILDFLNEKYKYEDDSHLADVIALFAKVSSESARGAIRSLFRAGTVKKFKPYVPSNLKKVHLWLDAIGFDTKKLKSKKPQE